MGGIQQQLKAKNYRGAFFWFLQELKRLPATLWKALVKTLAKALKSRKVLFFLFALLIGGGIFLLPSSKPHQKEAYALLLPAPEIPKKEQVLPKPPRPVIQEKGPSTLYGQPFFQTTSKKIALLFRVASEELPKKDELPPGSGVILPSFLEKIDILTKDIRQNRFEAFLHIPFAVSSLQDTGPDPFYSSLSSDDIRSKIQDLLFKSPGIVGVFTEGSSSLPAKKLMTFLENLKGYLYVENTFSPLQITMDVAHDTGISHRFCSCVVGPLASKREVTEALSQLEKLSQDTGKALGCFFYNAMTTENIKKWAHDLEEKKIKIVPVTTVMVQGGTHGY